VTPRFIVIPRRPPEALLGAPVSRLTVAARTARARDLNIARSELAVMKELDRWLADRADLVPATRRAQLARGGAVILDVESDEIEQIRRDLVAIEIVEDVALPRIPSIFTGEMAIPDQAGLWHLERLGLAQARAAGRIHDGSDVTVAVLDSGVDASHPDLAGRIDPAVVRLGNVFGYETSSDDHGHGTSIAGLVAGARTGVAPGARILPMQTILAQRLTLGELLIDWLPWLLENPRVDVVNLSLGVRRSAFSDNQLAAIDALLAQLLELDILPIAAIGNSGPGIACVPGQLDSVLSVGATNATDVVWSASGSAMALHPGEPSSPNVVAPGVRVTSTTPGGGYRSWSGSSHAAAVVSGVAALLLEHDRALTSRELRAEIVGAARPLPVSPDRQGRGIVSV
jgi:subtilisin family serine protease